MQKLMMTAVAAALLGLSGSAWACSDEAKKDVRDAWKEFGTGKIEEAGTAIKAACGCAPKMTMQCKGFTADGIYQIRNAFGALADVAKTYCSDAPSKKEWCGGVKTVVVKHGPADKISCERGSITVVGSGGSAAVNETDVKKCL